MEDEFEFHLHPILDVPPQLIAEAAVGIDSLEDICARYHYTPEQTAQLRNDPGFKARVSRMEQDLKKEGVTFRMRAAHAAEDLMADVWQQAKDPKVGLSMKLDALKTLAKLGDLEPKQNAQAAAQGSGFSLVINLPQVGNQPGRTIEMNRDVSTACEAEPLLVAASVENVNRSVNSSLELPEDWQDE